MGATNANMTDELLARRTMDLCRHKLCQPRHQKCLRSRVLIQAVYRCAVEEELVRSLMDCISDDLFLDCPTPTTWVADQAATNQHRTTFHQDQSSQETSDPSAPVACGKLKCLPVTQKVDNGIVKEEVAQVPWPDWPDWPDTLGCKRNWAVEDVLDAPDTKRTRGDSALELSVTSIPHDDHAYVIAPAASEDIHKEDDCILASMLSPSSGDVADVPDWAKSPDSASSPGSPTTSFDDLAVIPVGLLDELLKEDWALGCVNGLFLWPAMPVHHPLLGESASMADGMVDWVT